MNLILNNSNNEKGKFPSQPKVNPKYNSRGVHFCEDENVNPVNSNTTLMSGKKVESSRQFRHFSTVYPCSTFQKSFNTHSCRSNQSLFFIQGWQSQTFFIFWVGKPTIPSSITLSPSPPNATSSSSNNKIDERVYKPKAPFPHRLDSKKKPTTFKIHIFNSLTSHIFGMLQFHLMLWK